MAFDIVDQSYSGTYSSFFIQRATYQMDTVRKGLVGIVSNIGKQHTIGRLDYIKPLKPRQAVPTTNNSHPFTMDGRVLIPRSVDVYEEFNPRDLETNQLAEQLSTTIIDREVPPGLQSQMVQLVLNRVGEGYEDLMWKGSLDYAGTVDESDDRYQLQFMDGFLKRMVSDPLINLSSISPVVITISNIATILNDLIYQATIKQKALITDPDRFKKMKFIMSPATEAIYMEYLRTGATFKGNPFDTGYTPPWGQYRIESVAGMADNTILFLRATDETGENGTNLFAGMNSMKDWDLRVARTGPANETFFILGKWKWDVQYGWPQEIFMYTTLTAASFQP